VAIDNALSQSPADFEELLKLLREYGCEVSKRGKSYRLKLSGWEKAARMDSLGEGYGLEDLRAVLLGKKAHTPRKKTVTQAEPPKVNLLVDIQAKLLAGKGAGYARWAKVFNLKQMAQTMNYLSENNLLEYTDENGETKQKWETRTSYQDALKRKAEVENQQHTGTFLPPSNQTISEFLLDFVSLYGEKRWGVSMYDSQNSLIANYINPIIGDMKVQDVTPRMVDKYIQTLQKTPSVSTKTHKAQTVYVSDKTIEKIIKLLRCAFKQAVRWEIIGRNPFDNVILPKTEYKKRDIWDAEMIRTALDQCTDSKLYVAMNLSFACSLRMGEILGLTWDNVHISDEDIAADNAYVYIDKELTRASKRAIETLGEKDIYYIFTPLMPNTSTRLILKKPKTDSSIRKVWLPKPLPTFYGSGRRPRTS
jgi:hypothetical protein